MEGISSKSINLPPLEELDGVIFAFITRRNTIMTFAQELTPEQAVLAYLWGESTHSFASQPHKAGESVRIVGTDPFIIGSRAQKANRFYEIIMTLASDHPGKLKFMQYNTGGLGEIIERYEKNGLPKKRMVRKVSRVPINLMAQIQRGDLRATNHYEKGILGTKEIKTCEGRALEEYDLDKFYSKEQIQEYIHDLVEGRRRFTEEVAGEGLREEILYAAERSFGIDKGAGKKKIAGLEGPPEEEKPFYYWESKSRPRRSGFGRSK
jgi:phosphoenolpyruvate carboxykinase (ATP)